MSKDSGSDDDAQWQQIINEIKPLENNKFVDEPPCHKAKKPIISIASSAQSGSMNIYSQPEIASQNLPYLQLNDSSQLDRNLANKLRTGKLAVEASLDLHGHFKDDAMDRIAQFIATSYNHEKRCVRIITGKGKNYDGILFQKTPDWLNTPLIRQYIIMFCHAPQKDGGKGALYILLKRKR